MFHSTVKRLLKSSVITYDFFNYECSDVINITLIKPRVFVLMSET